MRVFLGALFALLVVIGVSSASGLKDENILMAKPDGYKTAFTERKNGVLVSEMIPEGENLDNWQDMLTLQVHFSRRLDLDYLEAFFTSSSIPLCEESDGVLVGKGMENGYEYGMFIHSCSTTPTTKSEIVLTKVVIGNDSSYFVIKSWRSEADQAEIVKWSRYMKGVQVCDSRIVERKCP